MEVDNENYFIFDDDEEHDLISDLETLYFKNSFVINRDRNNDSNTDFRIDKYFIDHIVGEDIRYRDFFVLITPNIKKYILKYLPNDKNPIKFTFLIHKDTSIKTNNIKTFEPDLEIYFSKTTGIDEEKLLYKINNAIETKGYIEYDWIYGEEKFNTLTIIQEKLTKPKHQEIENLRVKLYKTFKEDTCIVCYVNKTDILYCNCGHQVLCEECFDKLGNKNKCLKCREINNIIRKI